MHASRASSAFVLMLCVAIAAHAAPEPAPSLGERVTLDVDRATLRDGVSRLGKTSGTGLFVANPLASRPIMLHLRGVAVREAMDGISEFVATGPGKCSWKATAGDGFTLEEDAANRQARAALTKSQRVIRARNLVREIEAAMRLGLLPEAELARQRARYPELVYAMSTERIGLGILAGLTQEQRAALLSGRGLSLKVADLGPAEQDYARTMVGPLRRERVSVPPELGGGWIEWRADRDVPQTPVSMRLAGQPDRPGIQVLLIMLPVSQRGIRDVLHPAAPPEGERPPWLADILSERERKRLAASRAFVDQVRNDPRLAQKISLAPQVDVTDPAHPDVPQRRYADLSDTLAQVADQTGLSVIGDYDPCWDDYYTRLDVHNPDLRLKKTLSGPVPDVPVWQAMESIAQHFQVSWEKRGTIIYVHSPRIPYALMDGIDVLDPAPMPSYWQRLMASYKPGQPIPGVTYDP